MKFSQHYFSEAVLPLGFSTDDIETTDEFLKDELEESLVDEDITDAETSDIDIDALKDRRLDPTNKKYGDKQDIAKKPEKMLHKSNIVDENGNLIDNDALRAQISVRPKKLIGQNAKLAKSGSGQKFYDLTLPSYQGLYVNEATGEFKVVKTCPSAGECSKFCYAAKGGYVMFPASSMSATRVVNFLMNDYDGFKAQLISELSAAVKSSKDKVVLRWHDSGDFISEKYMLMAFEVAKETPNILHYAYTKQVPLVRSLESQKPSNFIFNFSLGGLHDDAIDTAKEKHARVVPVSMFKDLEYTKGADGYAVIFKPEALQELKDRVAKHFNLDPATVINYDEMMDIPEGDVMKWNVLVYKGHGDTAAARKDVLGTYLLFH